MSTRSVVIVKQEGQQDVYLYHHFDGYPDGVGYSLLCESKTWNKWNQWYNTSIVNELIKDKDDDGYEFYEKIAQNAHNYLNDNGVLLFEIGYKQAFKVKNIMTNSGFKNIIVKKDCSGLDRLIVGEKI